MSTTRTNNYNANIRRPSEDTSTGPEEAVDLLKEIDTDNHNQNHAQRGREQLEVNGELQVSMMSKSPAVGFDMEDDCTSWPGSHSDSGGRWGRGPLTQTIPSRCVSSTRRLLELLKKKYGEDGYRVEMRRNVYTVITTDARKGKLSKASLLELFSWMRYKVADITKMSLETSERRILEHSQIFKEVARFL